MADSIDLIDSIVSQYLKRFPEERANLAALIEQIVNEDQLDNHTTLPGHVTGCGFVLSPDRTQILLVHHKFLNMWLQPGGHWDSGEADPLTAAKREVDEETAIKIAEYLPLDADLPLVPFDLNTHEIPDRPEKDMPAHLHHDFRYVFLAESMEFTEQASEINQAGWFSFDAPECSNVADMIVKLKNLGFIEA